MRLRRRSVLTGSAAAALVTGSAHPSYAAATAATGGASAGARARARAGAGAGAGRAIDVHAHLLPAYWRRTLPGGRASGVPAPRWSPTRAVRFMDRHRIELQVLSLPDPAVTHLPAPASRLAMARRVNDHLASLVHGDRFRGRFAGLGVVPLGPDPTPAEVLTAAQEAQRALGELALDGVTLLSNYGATYLGHPTLTPLMTALDAEGAVVQLHGNADGVRPADDVPSFLLEAAFNTTRAIVSMSYLQTFTSNPDLRWVVGDAGGALPYLAFRSSLLQLYPAAAQNLGLGDLDDQSLDYGRLSYDTAHAGSSASRPALLSVREVAPVAQVLLGTDYPLSTGHLPPRGALPPAVRTVFSAEEREQVLRSNASRLFPRDA